MSLINLGYQKAHSTDTFRNCHARCGRVGGSATTLVCSDKQMLRISSKEYRRRLESLQASVAEAGLDLFIVSAFDSLYYLTGAGFEPLERPFFLLIRPRQAPILLGQSSNTST